MFPDEHLNLILGGAGWESVELSGKVWDSAHLVSCDLCDPRDRGPGTVVNKECLKDGLSSVDIYFYK